MAKEPATKVTGTKATRTSATSKSNTRQKKPTATTAAASRVRIRMYRLGVGDCFLVSFPRAGTGRLPHPHRLRRAPGAVGRQPEASRTRFRDLKTVLPNGKIDVVVGTHEHQDHLSGFPEIQKVLGAVAPVRSGRHGQKTPTIRWPKACGRKGPGAYGALRRAHAHATGRRDRAGEASSARCSAFSATRPAPSSRSLAPP